MTLCGFAGEKKNVGLISPNPNTPAFFWTPWAARYSGVFATIPYTSRLAVAGAGCQTMGVIQRTITEVRHDQAEKAAKSLRISSGNGRVCTTFGVGFEAFREGKAEL